jgi:hypothetical protein
MRNGLRRVRDGARNLVGLGRRRPEPALTATQLVDAEQVDRYLNPSRLPTPAPAYDADYTRPPSFRTDLSSGRTDPTNPPSRSEPPSFRTNASHPSDRLGDVVLPTQSEPRSTGQPRRPVLPRQSAFVTPPIQPSVPVPVIDDPSRSSGGRRRPTFTVGPETESNVSSATGQTSGSRSRTASNVSQTTDGAHDQRRRAVRAEREEHWQNFRQGRDRDLDRGHQ